MGGWTELTKRFKMGRGWVNDPKGDQGMDEEEAYQGHGVDINPIENLC